MFLYICLLNDVQPLNSVDFCRIPLAAFFRNTLIEVKGEKKAMLPNKLCAAVDSGKRPERINMASKTNTRRVSLAPGTKTEDGNTKDDMNPIKRKGEIKRSQDVRSQRDAYAKIVAEERAEQERELKELQDTIAYYRKENEKILKQQTTKFGITLDNMKYLTSDLHQAKATNDELYQEVEQRKSECGKLQAELDVVGERINDLVAICDDLEYENRAFKIERERIDILEDKILRLSKSNREMRQLLLKNKINPDLEIAALTPKQKRQSSIISQVTKLPTLADKHVVLTTARSMDSLVLVEREPKHKPQLKRMKSESYPSQNAKHTKLPKRRQSVFIPRLQPKEIFM